MPEELVVDLADTATTLAPSWAVADPDGGWQLLVRIEALGVDPDERGALAGWEATAHQRFERLLRETGVPTGLLLTDGELRLIHAPRGETSGWLAFPLRALASVGGRPMLGGLKLLLSAFRLHNDATERRLPSLLRASRAAQAEVSAKLATQVLGALHELLRGLHAADRARVERLAKQRPAHLYEGLLAVLLRLVFLLYAEDRALIPSRADGAARALYDEGYGVRSLHARLLADRARNPDTMDERRGAWGRLLALFRLVHAGDGSKWIRARGGKLFNPAEFPFLQGQDDSRDPADPAPVTDGCVLGVLDGLLTLDGERLSYRTLDVEQIGSVYETVMGFTVLTLTGPALALKVKPNSKSKHYTPVFVDLNALLATSGKERQKHLREAVGVKDANEKRGTALVSAVTIDDLARVLLPLVDERGSPGGAIAAPGTPLLQPTDERRRTGSHYTPRDLTEPIVRHALEPAFERIGDAATPEAVLALKVCDPAMGSGAFLVEACRQLAARLMQAWARHAGTRPPIPLDEDEDLLARRLVAQRCLYGVDRNPMATDLARLSLWLATLARDHEFTFLDHALKTGDSLVGLGRKQITWLHWQGEKGLPLFEITLKERIPKAIRLRSAIRHAPDDVALDDQIHAFREVEKETRELREVGDAILGAFFSHAKSKEREKALREVQEASGNADRMWEHLRPLAATLRQGEHPIRPFHWEIEFPEVFDGDAPGFDAIVGNPPFAGKNTLIGGHRAHYLDWLQTLHEGAHGNADLVAHFFRRAFALLRPGGCFGLIATNTIGQGDTRESGLRALLEAGGSILRAVRRTKWPGEAAVVVSLVHVRKGSARSPVLDGRQVRRISAYLVEGDLDASPGSLTANAGKAFIGCFLLGLGFTFDDAAAAKGKASPVSEMHRLIAKDNRNAERIFPYLGGEEVNTDPRHAHHRWVIDFNNFPLRRQEMVKAWAAMDEHERAACRRTGLVPLDYPDPVAADWPDLLEIVERLVKPERATNTDRSRREIWWQFTRRTPGLRQAIFGLKQVIVTNVGAAPHLAFAFLPADRVYAHTLGVVASEDTGDFGVCQSRTHETWARSFSSTLEDRLRYTPSDSLVSFPMPVSDETKDTAETYHDHRAALMIARNEGLTRTYNRFHDPAERASDIVRLRELHHAMDQAVLRAYGWDDLAEAAAPEFLTEDTEHDHRYQNRLFWPAPFRDEVLARLLALNAQRAAEERALGMAPARGDDEMALEEVE
ncbi:MAG: N-6 DNA methylase [Alphaproteobacteria bacterium]|nr:N-6 DNA methylase [Alphaproteobacteria bacterium]